MADSISGASDTELLAMALQMLNKMTAAPGAYGLTAAEVTPFGALRTQFETGVNDQATAQATAKAATMTKNDLRAQVEAMMRNLRAKAVANGTSESAMADLGIPPNPSSAPANATIPVGEVDTSERMRHTIRFYDQAANGNRKRPRGAVGCEIWVKIDGPPPTSEKDCTFLSLDTKSPYVADYDPTEANKTAHYLLRWQLQDGSKGTFGETVSATITA